ncbi:MAG TPA: hypothetical protein VGD45_04300 [Steroidobacter sp.]|uniref:hypothetical protein n=1 Tax=Steroidobacter sp. TaxID=1978227 RepID=UPI002ED94587
MSQQSEERLPESASAEANGAPGARILHLKGRQYDLQKAIQQRAQESVEREAALDQEERRPKPLKWLVAAAIAAIPIVLTLTAVDSFLKVFHKYMNTVSVEVERQQAEAAAAQAAAEAAAAAEAPITSDTPGVVMLQPMTVPEQQPAQPAPQSQQPDPATQPKK